MHHLKWYISIIVVSVNFTASQYTVREGARRLRAALQLSRSLQQRITVRVVLTGITAEGKLNA